MRMIDADALIEKLDAEPEGGYYSPHDVISLMMTQPTIELDWTELMVICDNCGHAIHVKRTDAKPIIEPERKTGTPCDLCRHNPPSSGDGKPCSYCPAE